LAGRFSSKRISGSIRPVTRQCSGTPSAAATVRAERTVIAAHARRAMPSHDIVGFAGAML